MGSRRNKKGKSRKKNVANTKGKSNSCAFKEQQNVSVEQIQQDVGEEFSEDRREDSLSFSQRKDRFVVVTTAVGVLFVVLKALLEMGAEFFARLGIDSDNIFRIKNLLFSYDQIMTTAYVATISIIMFLFIVYCILEMCNLKNTRCDMDVADMADKMYAKVFETAPSLLMCDTFICIIAISFFSSSKIYSMVTCVVIAGWIFALIMLEKNLKKCNNPIINYSLKRFFKDFFILCLVSVILFFGMFMTALNIDGDLFIYYNHDDIVLKFESFYYPKEIKVRVDNGEYVHEEICLFEQYGESTIIEKVSHEGNKEHIVINSNYYCYKYVIDISNWCLEGTNVIYFEFIINDEEYCISNTMHCEDGCSYTENELYIDL